MQISEELFIALLKYHLVEIDDVLPEIKKGLEEKLEAMVRRDLYTKYKTALTEEEKEKFTKQLGDVLKHVDAMNEVDTSNVEPMAHAIDLSLIHISEPTRP